MGTHPISDTYWPVFKQAVEADPNKVRPIKLICTVCTEEMTTDGALTGSIHMNFKLEYEHGLDHGAQILPCCHMLGAKCLVDWLRSQSEQYPNKKYYRCPVCSTQIKHHPCGHLCYGQRIPSTVAEYYRIPAVLGEGGFIHLRCSDCEVAFVYGEMGKYVEIYEWKDEVESRKQYIAFSVIGPRREFHLLATSPNVERPVVKLARVLETPEDLKAIWESHKQGGTDNTRSASAASSELAKVGALKISISILDDERTQSLKLFHVTAV
ncbi:hypothetical protein FBEOM_3733 [Fusarium beomiforme]|uniref:RING-type domain-containing protein n=1 Tax=Fusarium beomiforme TaxID=44412 RepID=A0A9P5DYV9_9HYPO|nr:hypothetical protein FBEOM_3733 [Fusarium beomiforme]